MPKDVEERPLSQRPFSSGQKQEGSLGRRVEARVRPLRTGRASISVTVAQLPEFDEVIDVRSEGEYGEDHVPGALNCPVLDNAERALVGTLYKQTSSFEAKKL